MKWLKSPWLLTVFFAIVIAVGSNWYIEQIMQEDTVPEDVMKSRLETMYQGTVQKMSEGDDGYEAEILRNGALYSATVDHKTGKVKTMTLLKEAKPDVAVVPKEQPLAEEKPVVTEPKPEVIKPAPAPKPDPQPQKKPAPAPTPVQPVEKPQVQPKPEPTPQAKPVPQPEKKKSVVLTGQQAVNIALTRLNANVPVEVDDVDYVETQQGGYYLVEIELDTEADLDEVVYQIHAISGKVLSVSWDD